MSGRPTERADLLRSVTAITGSGLVFSLLVGGCQSAEPEPSTTTPAATPSISMTVRMTNNRTLKIAERVQFSEPSYSLSLSPDPPQVRVGAQDRYRPVIVRLRVEAPGQPVRHVRRVDFDTRVSFGEPVGRLSLHYTLRGVVRPTQPSVPGRYSAYVTALEVDLDDAAERVIRVQRALSLGCAGGDDKVQPCGHRARNAWVVRLTPDETTTSVLAQLQST